MAQALARSLMPEKATFLSAGTHPAEAVDPGALVELARRGIDARDLRPKAIAALPSRVDLLVTMGCGVSCPTLPFAHREDWGLDDPMGGPAAGYAACADAIVERLGDLRERMSTAGGTCEDGADVDDRG
jgi:arsenate reductase